MIILLPLIVFLSITGLLAYVIAAQSCKTVDDNNYCHTKSYTPETSYFLLRQQHKQSAIKNTYNGECPPKTYIDLGGYRRFTYTDKLVSHWVAEKFVVRRKLNYGEVVHHIDGNKLNNKPGNLTVFINQQEHLKHHQNNYKYGGAWHAAIPEYVNY